MLVAVEAGAVLVVLAVLDIARRGKCQWKGDRRAMSARRSARLRAVPRYRSAASTAPPRGGGGWGRPARSVRPQTEELVMLRVYPVLLDLVRSVGPLIRVLERRDPDLARQCRRALASAPLNLVEGSYNRGGNRPARYHTALGSLREALACLEVAAALGYLPAVDPALRARFDHVLGTLVRLVGGH